MVVTFAALMLLRVSTVVAGALAAGTEGVGAALVATALVNVVVWHAQATRLLGHHLRDLWVETWRSLVAAAIMAAAVAALRALLPAGTGSGPQALLTLAALVGTGACVHIGTQYALWRLAGAPEGAERRILSLAAQVLARWGATRTQALSR
jgi:PST family polysaccharide transporter